ncbi:MAG TPA: hypothetical protein VJ724_15625 [Tahibacter sp.]|nr:hypothetical protein [Tahibacter sp.]
MRISSLTFALVLAIYGLLSSSEARADQVTIDGVTVSCTNTCNVTIHGPGRFTVVDCCGGRVFWRPA